MARGASLLFRLGFLFGVSLAVSPAALAHIVPVGLGMQTYLKVEPDRVHLEYNLGYSSLAGFSEALKMETSRNDIIEKEEIEAWLDAIEPKILGGLTVTLDGKPLRFHLVERKIFALFAGTNVKRISGAPFDTWWKFETEVDLPPGEHEFVVHDHNFEREISQSIIWFSKLRDERFKTHAFETIPKGEQVIDVGTDWQLSARAARLFVECSPEVYARRAPAARTVTAAAEDAATSRPAGMRAVAEKGARAAGVEYRGADESEEGRALVGLKDRVWYLALALALLWGAAHALAPGHGKSMVAAFLLGKEGRIADALSLGAIVTFTHTASIFVLALVVFFVADRLGMNPNTAAGRAMIWMEVGSGLIVFLMGVGLLHARIREIEAHARGHAHGHGHGHGHDHGHRHGHGEKGQSILALGFAAGFQPCTAGIALVFIAVAQGWLWRGLYLLVAFSLGLGLVIVSIAVAMVAARSLLAGRLDAESRLLRALPALSAATLTAVGAWVVIDVLMKNRIGPFG